MHGCQGFQAEEKEPRGGAQDILRAATPFCLILEWDIHDKHFSKPTELENTKGEP